MIKFRSGLSIHISSFTDLIEKITDRITQIIFNSEIDESNYLQTYEITKILLHGNLNNQPYEKAVQYFTKIIKHNITSYRDMIRISSFTSFQEFTKIYKNLQKSFYVVSEFYGNMNEKQLLKIESFMQPFLNQDINLSAQVMNVEENKVLDFMHYHKNFTGSYVYRTINDMPTEVNHAIINYFQVGKRDLRKSLIMNLVELSFENVFYYNLRTVKQFGYIVASSKYVKDNFMYYLFLVQGSKITPEKLNIEIDEVLKLVRTKLEELEEDQLNEYKDTLIAELNKKNNNLKERSELVWKEIYENSLDFNRRYKLIEELKNITIEDLIQHFVETFYTNVRKMSIQVYSQFKFEEALMSTRPLEEPYYLNQDLKTIISDEYDLLKYN